ncbi:MAG: hypothetical protein V7720_08805 [Halioglobus sp.]
MQQALTVFLLFMALTTKSFAASWNTSQFNTEIGSVVSSDNALILAPNDSGQILLSVPANQLILEENYRVSFKFADQPPSQIFVIWRTDSSTELYQKKFLPMGKSQPSIDMIGIEGWTGTAASLKFGFFARPGQKVSLLQASASEPGISDHVKNILANWSGFMTWAAADVNVYTGTRESSSGPYPAQIFAGLTLALIVLYIALRRKKATWQGAGLIVLCSWLTLDSFWQLQLWRQIGETKTQYGGMSSHEKLLASEDAPFVQFADAARPFITGTDARVFIAGSSDYQTMVSAYYMSPANTFWHRHGPELPDARYLRTGDYIVLLRASEINYQAAVGAITLADGKQLKVREHMSDSVGALLEVL